MRPILLALALVLGGPADDRPRVSSVIDGNGVVSHGLSFSSTTTLAPAGTTQTVNWALGNVQFLDMESVSGNLTVTLSGATNNSVLELWVQTSAANPTRTLTITGVKWPSGVVPTQTAVADAVDLYACTYIGSVYRCSQVPDSK